MVLCELGPLIATLNSAAGSPKVSESRKCCHPRDQHRLGSTGRATALQMKDLGILVDSELSASLQCTLVAVMANHMLGCICKSVDSRTRTVIVRLSSVLVDHILKDCFQLGSPV